ncbi:DUF1275 family protein [Streptomyces sp. NPDC090127]|uniref:DUF1275 family protein n=1 Tax=Streptomyces sp. NPDC090127 TaxID=3365953 RepID=UPI0037FDA0FC
MRKLLAAVAGTLVPPKGDRHGPLLPLLLLATVVTGIVDAASFLALGQVFVGNMTGNVLLLGFALAGAEQLSASASVVAFAAFLTGAAAGGRIGGGSVAHRGRLLAVATALEALLVVAAVVTATVAHDSPGGGARYTLVVLLALAMGLQSATARRLGIPDLTTTVVTQTLTGLAAEPAPAGGVPRRSGRRVLSVLAMFLGALVGAALVLYASLALTLGLALLLLVVICAVAYRLSSADAAWTAPTA